MLQRLQFFSVKIISVQDRINTFLLLLIFVTNFVIAVFISKFSSDLDSIRTATYSTAAYTETIQKNSEKKNSI